MIRRSDDKISIRKPSPFNGVGEITVRSLLNGPEEMENKGRVFGHTTVYPGSKIGLHTHKGDAETYYILSGSGNRRADRDDRADPVHNLREIILTRNGAALRTAILKSRAVFFAKERGRERNGGHFFPAPRI